MAATTVSPPDSLTPYPVNLDVEYPERLSRVLIFFKWLLIFPQFIMIYLLMSAWYFTAFISWFAILFTGRYPRSLFDFAVGVYRWAWRVNAYVYLLRDEYPPFRLTDEEGQVYPVEFTVEYPEHLSRGLIFVKWLLVFPHLIILYVLNAVTGLTTFFAWFAILFTARYPKGLFDLSVGYLRWSARVGTYAMLLRDEYPPFRLSV